MPKFSIEKLNEIRNSKGYTLKELAEMTDIPHSTISKIFAGFNKNPSIEAVQKIANALECGIDDFIEYESEPKSPYYTDRQTGKIAQEIFENKDLRILFDASKDLSPEDIKAVVEIAKRIKSTKK
jgi:transcriptional regulator with XRE-family HTH domain|nr:MAG TPA: helix-turn-helix domain protein [Caudoviricetes sp.]